MSIVNYVLDIYRYVTSAEHVTDSRRDGERGLDDIACRTGKMRGDRDLAPRQRIHQDSICRHWAGRESRPPVAQALAAPVIRQLGGDLRAQRRERATRTLPLLGSEVLLGKVDLGFELGLRRNQTRTPILAAPPNSPPS